MDNDEHNCDIVFVFMVYGIVSYTKGSSHNLKCSRTWSCLTRTEGFGGSPCKESSSGFQTFFFSSVDGSAQG
jgi:hypothetical protein